MRVARVIHNVCNQTATGRAGPGALWGRLRQKDAWRRSAPAGAGKVRGRWRWFFLKRGTSLRLPPSLSHMLPRPPASPCLSGNVPHWISNEASHLAA